MANVRQVTPQAMDIIVTGTLTASAAAGSVFTGNIETMAGSSTTSKEVVPGDQAWHIESIINGGSDPTPDCRVELVVNGWVQPFTPSMLVINQADFGRMKLPRTIMLGPAGNLQVRFRNLAAVGTDAVAVEVHLQVMVWPRQQLA